MKIIIEGIDRLGKSTLSDALIDELGFHMQVHLSGPRVLSCYDSSNTAYIEHMYVEFFNLIHSVDVDVIFDRGHLSEIVYSSLYRPEAYVNIECAENITDTSEAVLILLTTSDFSLCVDDGKSHCFENKGTEQRLFIEAFNSSTIEKKVMIDVSNGGGQFRDIKSIVKEIRKCVNI